MRVLLDLEQRLQSFEVTLKDCQLPQLTQEDVAMVEQLDAVLSLPATIREELDFDVEGMRALAREHVLLMTEEQKDIYNLVMDRVSSNLPLQLFVDARGGCGKTFTLEAILAGVRSSEPGGAVALAMGMTGLAANLLPLGRTFHSRMKVELSLL